LPNEVLETLGEPLELVVQLSAEIKDDCVWSSEWAF
jgi:hypothetical protein